MNGWLPVDSSGPVLEVRSIEELRCSCHSCDFVSKHVPLGAEQLEYRPTFLVSMNFQIAQGASRKVSFLRDFGHNALKSFSRPTE